MNADPSKPLKIVLIDDEPTILKFMAKALRHKGYEVETYGSATECVAAHHGHCPCQHCPDVILTDIDIPHMNGIEFLNLLHKKNCSCKHIALMTGGGMDNTRLHKIEKKGLGCSLNPFPLRSLLVGFR